MLRSAYSFRMNGKAKVKTTTTTNTNATTTTAQQCDAIVNRYYYYFGMEVGCIEVYAWMTHLAICYITLFHDVTTSQTLSDSQAASPVCFDCVRLMLSRRCVSLHSCYSCCVCVVNKRMTLKSSTHGIIAA